MLLYNFFLCSTLFLAAHGRPNVQIGMRIAGGELSTIEEHPYMVTMYLDNFGNGCGGSIIARNLILTASHCIPEDFKKLEVRSGSTYQILNGTTHRIVSYIRHEDYKLLKSETGGLTSVNDIAIAKVEPPLEFDETRQPISLFNAGEAIKPGSTGEISGWGFIPFMDRHRYPTEDVYLSRIVSVSVPIYEKSDCARRHIQHQNYTLKPGQMCAGHNNGACRGDSGGPLIVDGRQAGIATWGYSCKMTGLPPTVYTEVSHFRNWIDEKAFKLAGVRLDKVVVTTEKPLATNTIEYHHPQDYYDDRPIWT